MTKSVAKAVLFLAILLVDLATRARFRVPPEISFLTAQALPKS